MDSVDRLADALAAQITPPTVEDSPHPVQRRWGTVAAVNADGTLNVTLSASGVTIPSVKRLASAVAALNDTVAVDFAGPDPVVVGRVADAPMIGYVPVGAMVPFLDDDVPTNWLACIGQSLLRASWPELFAVIGTRYGAVNGNEFSLPNTRQRFPMGQASPGQTGETLGATGGSKDAIVVSHSHNHSHSGSTGGVSSDHAHWVGGVGNHNHVGKTTNLDFNGYDAQGYAANNAHWAFQTTDRQGVLTWGGSITDAGAHDHGWTGGISANHGHAFGTSADATGAGSSGTDARLPPFLVVVWIVRAR